MDWWCTCSFTCQVKHVGHFVKTHCFCTPPPSHPPPLRRSFTSTTKTFTSDQLAAANQLPGMEQLAFCSSSSGSQWGFGGPEAVQAHRGLSPLPRPWEETHPVNHGQRPSFAHFLCPRRPLRRQESQYTCPQLVRLKDDFLCGGWKHRLQNTQLAMTAGPREAHVRPSRGQRGRRGRDALLESQLCACASFSACVLGRDFPIRHGTNLGADPGFLRKLVPRAPRQGKAAFLVMEGNLTVWARTVVSGTS